MAARYNEGTLGRILAGSTDVSARRAAVLSLGSWKLSSKAMRSWARLCATMTSPCGAWPKTRSGPSGFGPITPSTIRSSSRCGTRSAASSSSKPRRLVNRLIADAPDFAEAYNQRAFIYFLQGRFAESAEDCQRVLARNPYHIGAIEGLAKCQLSLNRPRDALKSFAAP